MVRHLVSAIFSFKGLYVAFVIAVIFYGQVRMLFGATPRHIAIAAMIIACMRQGVSFPIGRMMKAYFVFILTFLVSATVTGHLGDVLITYYIAACTGFLATKTLIIKYKAGGLLLNTIIILGLVDAVVTIGQMLSLPFADQLVSAFQLQLPEKYLDKMDQEGSEDMALLLLRPGLFNSAVYNGYFLMTTGVASLALVAHKYQLLRLIPWIIITLGCICVQERSPIIILAALSAFAFYKILFIKKSVYAILLTIFVLIVFFLTEAVVPILSLQRIDTMETHDSFAVPDIDAESGNWADYSNFMKESRFAELGMDDTGRSDIYSQATEYLMDHPFVGGYHRLVNMHNIAPHNLFLNAFIYGGFIGGLAILVILFWQVKPLWRVLRQKIADTNPVCFFMGLSYIAFTLNSLAHNRSIVTGDEFLWMLWAAFYYEYRKYYTTPKL